MPQVNASLPLRYVGVDSFVRAGFLITLRYMQQFTYIYVGPTIPRQIKNLSTCRTQCFSETKRFLVCN